MASHEKNQHKQADADGRFRRQDAQFRSQISKDGPFPPEKGRYLLYCALICPWACRTLIVRSLKGLEDVIDVSITGYKLGKNGWDFTPEQEGCTADPVNNFPHTKAIYQSVDPNYNLRYTIPILYDKKTKKIVNNESSEIIRFFNSEFDEFVEEKYRGVNYYPDKLRPEIDALNEWVYHTVNNGVYKTGFATTQEAYEETVYPLFKSLDRLEQILKTKRYLMGDILTEADIRLFTTIVRFDVAYKDGFRCNIGSIRHDYPALHRWLRMLYWGEDDSFRKWSNFKHIKEGYYSSPARSPSGVVPAGPKPDIEGPLKKEEIFW